MAELDAFAEVECGPDEEQSEYLLEEGLVEALELSVNKALAVAFKPFTETFQKYVKT